MGMIDGKKILAAARDNIARRSGCAMHHFDAKDGYRLGQKLTCRNCGTEMRLSEISFYARGYAAAGGDPDDILTGLVK